MVTVGHAGQSLWPMLATHCTSAMDCKVYLSGWPAGQSRQANVTRKGKDMFAKWTDEMVREYFDTHWNATLHEICALSGRTKADVKRVLMGG